ncbi:HTH-type transcriptional regulator MtrR [bacterium BMS3Abin07]|nr:HTH-type transcriptional regulator MtrR [bacterium BMS3Abin07]GBE32356.1 HTH-type transcriptional regulator MtrR [bacterium BMS3Bbin05]HDL20548.1 TetR/AcrR family transcriptional regulator [Nitrospirota bacterium]HDZ88601.1 TetR/AcrR family transcriptional regulator [Nitrospirota bacterium]
MNKTSQKLILATEKLLRKDGLARVTTRVIAREAGVAEGVLYHHFKDKAELLHAVVQYSMGDFREVLESLPLQVGQHTVRENLEHMLQAAFAFQFRIAPIVCSLFADRQLLARTREILSKRRIGPKCSVQTLAAYLQTEQRLGRVAADVPPQAAAELLLSSSFHAAMFDHFLARKMSPAKVRLRIHEAVNTLLTGLEPRISEKRSVPKYRSAER